MGGWGVVGLRCTALNSVGQGNGAVMLSSFSMLPINPTMSYNHVQCTYWGKQAQRVLTFYIGVSLWLMPNK
jgi:hypothetical protein